MPRKKDGAEGHHFGTTVLERVKEKKVWRNVSCNLAWTGPATNTVLGEDFSVKQVENFVMDTFLDSSAMAPEEPELAPPDTATVEPSELANDQFVPASEVAQEETSRNKRATAKRVWRVPAQCPPSLNIPIVLTSTTELPPKGQFRRYGMDCVVNGVWLALYWAIEDQDEEAIKALEHLILNWLFDFELFEVPADTPNPEGKLEELIFVAITNLPLRVERLRDFFGFTGKNLMLVCGQVRQRLKRER